MLIFDGTARPAEWESGRDSSEQSLLDSDLLATHLSIGIYISINRIIGTFHTVGTGRDLSLHYDRHLLIVL